MGLLGAHMADGAVHQAQPRLYGPGAYTADGLGIPKALDFAFSPEIKIDGICVVYGLLSQLFSNQIRQIPPHLAGKGQLSVRKGAGAGESRCDMAAWPAVHAYARLCFRAAPVLKRPALFHHNNFFLASAAQHFEGSEDAGRTGADNHDVCFHSLPSKSYARRYEAVR